MSTKRKRKAKAKPPPVVADLFDVPDELPTAPPTPAPRETVARVASSSSGEEGATAAPLEPVRESPSLAVLEVLGFPAVHVADLPAPFTLRCELEGAPFVFTSSRAAYAEAREGGVPVFVMRELVALAHAAQNDRMPPHVLGEVLERKRETPSLVVEPRYAFGGMVIANAEPITCTVGDALERMGVVLVALELAT